MTEVTRYQKLLNRNNQAKRQDNFYVEFFNMDSNMGNYLGKQVREISRPNLTVEATQISNKGNKYKDPGYLTFDPISITFDDDEESLTSMLLYAQVIRQQEKYRGGYGFPNIFAGDNVDTFKFGLKVQLFNSLGEETEGFILKDAFFTSLEHSENIYSSDSNNTISTMLTFDNIEYKIFNEFIEIKTNFT